MYDNSEAYKENKVVEVVCGYALVNNGNHCINEKTGKCDICKFNAKELNEAVKQVVIQYGSTLKRLADN